MSTEHGRETGDAANPRAFVTTHWSVILSAKEGGSGEADAALEWLCRKYWWPIHAFVLRRGHDAHDAQDLTQEFFTRLLADDFLRGVDRSKGKFRSFLLAALDHFLAKEWRRNHAQKRGGRFTFLSLDDETAERHCEELAVSTLPPEKIFDQQWALTVLDQAVSRVRAEFVADGKGELFEALKVFLTGEKRNGAYAELAVKLQTTEAALKMAVSRMRKRYRELVRAEIAQTVAKPEDVEEELRALRAALA